MRSGAMLYVALNASGERARAGEQITGAAVYRDALSRWDYVETISHP